MVALFLKHFWYLLTGSNSESFLRITSGINYLAFLKSGFTLIMPNYCTSQKSSPKTNLQSLTQSLITSPTDEEGGDRLCWQFFWHKLQQITHCDNWEARCVMSSQNSLCLKFTFLLFTFMKLKSSGFKVFYFDILNILNEHYDH